MLSKENFLNFILLLLFCILCLLRSTKCLNAKMKAWGKLMDEYFITEAVQLLCLNSGRVQDWFFTTKAQRDQFDNSVMCWCQWKIVKSPRGGSGTLSQCK